MSKGVTWTYFTNVKLFFSAKLLSVALLIKQYDLLNRVELMDYLDSIDCSLEDFQAMLYGKQFSAVSSILEVCDGGHDLIPAHTAPSTEKRLSVHFHFP